LSLLLSFFTALAPTHLYPLSLHDALPICPHPPAFARAGARFPCVVRNSDPPPPPKPQVCAVLCLCERFCVCLGVCDLCACRGGPDRKSTRLNSSHDQISYAVFCLKKKNRS